MLNKAQENMIQSICIGLNKLKKKRKVLAIVQIIIDFYLFTCLFTELLTSFYVLPFITLILIISKAIFTILKHDIISCAVCSILNLSAFVSATVFKIIDYNTVAAFIIAFFIYGFRVKQYIIDKKIASLYGYPTFNSFFIINELKKDESLTNDIVNDYESIENDRLLKNEIEVTRMNPLITIIHLLVAIGVAAGIVMLCNGLIISIKTNNAGTISKISTLTTGTYFFASTDKICGISNSSMDKHTEDIYWCVIGEECVTIKVPHQYKKDFATLYGSDAEYNENSEQSNYTNKKIEFHGIIRNVSKYDSGIINTKVINSGEDTQIIKDKYVEIVSQDNISKNIGFGGIVTLIGVVTYIITILFSIHKED